VSDKKHDMTDMCGWMYAAGFEPCNFGCDGCPIYDAIEEAKEAVETEE